MLRSLTLKIYYVQRAQTQSFPFSNEKWWTYLDILGQSAGDWLSKTTEGIIVLSVGCCFVLFLAFIIVVLVRRRYIKYLNSQLRNWSLGRFLLEIHYKKFSRRVINKSYEYFEHIFAHLYFMNCCLIFRKRHRKNVLADYKVFEDEGYMDNASEIQSKSIRMENPRQSK